MDMSGLDFDLFYSSVILNSTETFYKIQLVEWEFYSSVILNSTETLQGNNYDLD